MVYNTQPGDKDVIQDKIPFIAEHVANQLKIIQASVSIGVVPYFALDILFEHHKARSSDLFVAIGPGLQRECFEVRSDVFNQFPKEFLDKHPDKSKRLLNLSAYVYQQIISKGVLAEHIHRNTDCTKCNQEKYYSYRRDGEKSGRMMGIIGINS